MLFAGHGSLLFPNPEEDVEDINVLLKELSKRPRTVTEEDIQNLIGQQNVYFAVRRDEGRIIAMALLFINRKFTGSTGYIEDVVVHKDYRKRGLAISMIEEIALKAIDLGLPHIELTSSPDRVEANLLYQKIGFIQRETNVYRLTLHYHNV